MINIESLNNGFFEVQYNWGTKIYPADYYAYTVGDKVKIRNRFNDLPFLQLMSVDDISVNGVTYGTAEELANNLTTNIFQQSSGGGGSIDLTPVIDKIDELVELPTELYNVRLDVAGNYNRATILAGYTGTKTIINAINIAPDDGLLDSYSFNGATDGNQTILDGVFNYRQSGNGDIGTFTIDVINPININLTLK